MKTSIKPGEVLDLNVECEGGSLYIGAWVDWNGNGSFDEAGEFIGYLPKGTIKVSIPVNMVMEKQKTIHWSWNIPTIHRSLYPD